MASNGMELFVVKRRGGEVLKSGLNNKREAKAHRDSILPEEELKQLKESNGSFEASIIISRGRDHTLGVSQ